VPAPHERDLEQTRERLERWLVARHASALELQVGPLAGPQGTGFSSDTLMFELRVREPGGESKRELVVRLEPRGFRIFPHYDVARQHRLLRALADTGVPVPRTLWLERSPEPLGAPFYVMERVEGRIPGDTPPYHAEGWVTRIDDAERAALWWSGLEALARIHGLGWERLGLAFVGAPEREGTPLERQLDAYERFLAWAARGRPQPAAEAGLAWLRRQRPREPEPVVLCWGDARLGNMIFRDGRCVAVLDWEMATLGSPEADLAWWLFFDRHHSEGCGVPRLAGFPSREETLARYEAWTGHRVRHLHYYEVFAAFRFSVIMIRLAQQLVRYGLLPEDSEFERSNIATHLLRQLLDGE
jgi:aminoglycoside phosphotransferase (APT) family kinase protein